MTMSEIPAAREAQSPRHFADRALSAAASAVADRAAVVPGRGRVRVHRVAHASRLRAVRERMEQQAAAPVRHLRTEPAALRSKRGRHSRAVDAERSRRDRRRRLGHVAHLLGARGVVGWPGDRGDHRIADARWQPRAAREPADRTGDGRHGVVSLLMHGYGGTQAACAHAGCDRRALRVWLSHPADGARRFRVGHALVSGASQLADDAHGGRSVCGHRRRCRRPFRGRARARTTSGSLW